MEGRNRTLNGEQHIETVTKSSDENFQTNNVVLVPKPSKMSAGVSNERYTYLKGEEVD